MSLTRLPLLVTLTIALMLAASAMFAPTARAATTITVTSLTGTQTGSCPSATSCTTIYAALQAAANGDTITFSPGLVGVIQLQNTLQLTKSVTIQGPGASSLALDGQDTVGVLNVSASATVKGLTIRRGRSDSGAGINLGGGTFTLTDSVVKDNVATNRGGGIYLAGLGTSARADIVNTTLDNNRADTGGGVLDESVSSVLANQYTMTFTRSTISNNQASNMAGGFSANQSSRILLEHTTVSGNSAVNHSGGFISGSGSHVVLRYATVAGNSASNFPQFQSVGDDSLEARNSLIVAATASGGCGNQPVASLGNNLSNNASCLTANAGKNDRVVADVKIGPLALNAPGTTKTHALLADSPALNGVTYQATDCGTGADATDQRGAARPGATYGTQCDIGAYELVRLSPTITQLSNQTMNEDEVRNLVVTVGDQDTPLGQLTVTASAVNTTLLPSGALGVGGSGETYVVQLRPPADLSGSSNVTVTVSDGTSQASTTFLVTVVALNDAPVNSVPPTQPLQVPSNSTLPFDSAHQAVFSVSDVDGSNVEVTLSVSTGTLNYVADPKNVSVSGSKSSTLTVSGPIGDVNGFLPAVVYTPPTGFSGLVTLTVTTSDQGNTGAGGTKSDIDTVAITVTNQAPMAAANTYAVSNTQALAVTAANGLLANDTDPEGNPLQAQKVTDPAHGTLVLAADGGFSYTPNSGYVGTDTFTYRAFDGTATSAPATVTITVSPTKCSPRATVKVSTAVVNGKLQATVEALPLATQASNRLRELRFGELKNGTVTINGVVYGSGSGYSVPGTTTTTVTFTVERITAGVPTTIPLTVTDECSDWPTFVGGGDKAGF